MSIPATVAHGVQQAQEWLKELRDYGDLPDEETAYSVLRAVLHQLRDRLAPEEAADLGAQLSLVVRGIYFEGYRPGHVPEKVRSKQEFCDGVAAKLQPHRIAPEPAVRDVFAILAQHCDLGEISDVIDQLPKDIKGMWPEGARKFKGRQS